MIMSNDVTFTYGNPAENKYLVCFQRQSFLHGHLDVCNWIATVTSFYKSA